MIYGNEQEREAAQAWLQNLSKGEEVVIYRGVQNMARRYRDYTITRVTRVTATQVEVEGHYRKFSKSKGGEVGGKSMWPTLVQPTDQIRQLIEQGQNLDRLARLAGKPEQLTPAQVAAMLAAYDATV